MHLLHAWVLLLLLPVALLGVSVHRSRGQSGGRRHALESLTPGVALALLVLALSAPQIGGGDRRPTVLAVDRSASIDPGMRVTELRWGAQSGGDDCVAPCRPVDFAASADPLAGDPGNTAAAAGVGSTGSTDLESAISTAIAKAPDHGRVVVLSDGGQTAGDVLADAGPAASRDVEVDWVPLSDAHRRDAAITYIHVPAAVRVGDEVPLALTIHSTVAGAARLRIVRDGAAAQSETIRLRVGDNPLLLAYSAARRGWNSFEATVTLPGDAVAADNSQAAVVDVGPAPRVLVISGDGGSPVPGLLAAQHLSVSTIAAPGLPVDAAAYAGYDAVVLDDLPATSLTGGQITALNAAVRTGGMGLVALGGPHSFSEGHYWNSRLQQILPVRSRKPGNLQRKNLAVELVLDHSGSMIDLAGGAPKIAEARASAHQAASFIANHRDQLGVVDFDTAAHTLVPLTSLAPGASLQKVDAQINTLQASGGTNIYGGLQAGFDALLKSHAPERHLILVTDGISTGSDYGPLLALIKREKIAVATVALGADADRTLLAQIARSTGGHTYATDNANDLPRILVKETQQSAKPARDTGRLKVSVSGDSPVLRSLAGTQLPDVSGNIVVSLKNGAQADLRVTGDTTTLNPALAEWQIGAGRVLAWTPGLGAPWGQSWLMETAFWNDVVRWADRGIATSQTEPTTPTPGVLQIDLASRGSAVSGVTALAGTLIAADGSAHPVAFSEVSPALFQADVSGLAEGVYRYAIRGQGGVSYSASGEVAIPYPAEYSPTTVRTSPLGQLVARTGGRILNATDPGSLATHRHSLQRLLALLAFVVFLLGVAARLDLWRGRRRSAPSDA